MGYYSSSKYRGDWYGQKGDYYPRRRGDLLSDVLGAVRGAAPYVMPAAGALLGGPLGGALGAVAGKLLAPGAPAPSNPFALSIPPAWAATSPGTASTSAVIPVTPAGFMGSIGGSKGLVVRTGSAARAPVAAAFSGGGHRRMNILNPKALKRALRRAEGFKGYATRVLKLVGEKRTVVGFKKCRKAKKRLLG